MAPLKAKLPSGMPTRVLGVPTPTGPTVLNVVTFSVPGRPW